MEPRRHDEYVPSVSDQRRTGDPTAEAIEALVRAIEAKEASQGAVTGGTGPVAGGSLRPGPAASGTPTSGASPGLGARRSQVPPYRSPGSPPGRSGPIPGLIGRQAWEASLVDEAERQQRYGRPLAILLAEVEASAPEPSAMGAAMIGRMAPRCAAVLLALARGSDRVTRLSGNRFGVLLLEADEAGAAIYAERAATVCATWLASSPYPMRLSVGWSVAREPADLVGAMRKAEERLKTRD